jgi:trans-aconitate methyltransferase
LLYHYKNNLLEIGCGPGTLSHVLHKWYPNLYITGVDRDTNFIKYAKMVYGDKNLIIIRG